MHKQTGFTLMEVMIVVVILAILGAIGYPAYTDYTRRGKIAEAVSVLSDARAKMEQYFLDNRTYQNGSNCGFAPGDTTSFTVTCSATSATAYTVTATGRTEKGMAGFTYTINQTGAKATTSLPSNWSGSGSNCWVLKKDGSC